jgi:hypothetical protein
MVVCGLLLYKVAASIGSNGIKLRGNEASVGVAVNRSRNRLRTHAWTTEEAKRR